MSAAEVNTKLRYILIILLAAAELALGGGSQSSTQPTSQPAALKTLQNDHDRFKLDYPASWKCARSSLKTVPKSAAEVETEFTAGCTPSRLASSENDASVDDLVRAAKSEGDKIESDEHILLGGAPARKIVLTGTDKIFETKAILVLTIRNGKQYKVVYSGPPDSFELHRAEVDAIIKSWKWTDSAK